MKKKNIRNSVITAVLFLIFVDFTLLVRAVDVQPVGPRHSEIGFASINTNFHSHFLMNEPLYKMTSALGILALVVAACFALLGLIQLIKRKSLFKVDYQILILGAFYVIVGVFYIFFEKCIVNYRPVIMDEGLEASYPSSHTMLIVCIMGTAMILFKKYFAEKRGLFIGAEVLSAIIIVATVVGRLLCGVHWLTDIIGGILLSAALVMLYYTVLKVLDAKLANK